MEQKDIRENTILIFKEVFKNTTTFSDTTSADNIAAWDSLNHMVLIGKLEQKFNLKFDLFKLIELRNVGDFIQYISNELNNGNQGN